MIQKPHTEQKNKGNVSLNDLSNKAVTGRKVINIGIKNATLGLSVGKAQKGLARASKPSSGKAVQSVSETKVGLATPVDLGENNSIPLASNEPVHGQMRGGSQKQAQGSDEHAADPFKYPIALHNSLLNVEEISRVAELITSEIDENSPIDLSRHQGEEVEFHSSDHQPILVAFMYGSPDKTKRKVLCNDLSCSVQLGDDPWMAIGGFNTNLSLDDKKGDHIKGRRCSLGNLPSSAFLGLNSEDVSLLGKNVTNEEIMVALFDMAPLKAPAQEVLHSIRTKKNFQWMEIKIDLEKAYDRVRWDFVEAFLNAACIPSYLIKVIMNAISLTTMQVLWNGEPTQKFRFYRSIPAREWSPIRLSCTGPSLLHLFFADDLVIFKRADLLHSGLLKNFLSNFCETSGHKVFSWDAKKLSFAGRVTLAQSILLSIPSYLMQKKEALVGWDDICQPKMHGGLGFRRLGDQNKAFMMKISYNLITKSETLWVQVFRAKYGVRESMSNSLMRSSCSYMWKAIAKAWPLLHSNMIWSIGNGKTVRCWEDNCVLNKGPLKHYVLNNDNINFATTVSEMIQPNGDWNLNLFKLWMPKEVVECIISIPPPLDQAGPDVLSWSRMTTEVFCFCKKCLLFVEGEDLASEGDELEYDLENPRAASRETFHLVNL
ncbi:hypothetical protein PVK06_039821 [Gossypium arboreum]|uniref:Reverse transcriptase domain-containing protein n=1 Tax=Gossypium arboreum TaxID=29729 RepID=A0ABR0N3W6_GOSAR|nr:hypothetical protein PVK06_039821 [Gossypium arboreum]